MIPAQFSNFFLASAGAAGALVGLLFVAIAVDPTKTVMESATIERRAAASSAFGALSNAFFVSLGALIPNTNIGYIALIMSIIGLSNTFLLSWSLLGRRQAWASVWQRVVLLLGSFALYGAEAWNGAQVLRDPHHDGAIYGLVYILLATYGLGLVRAWELLGARRNNLLGFLERVAEHHHDKSVVQPSPQSDTSSTTMSASQSETR
jgi:hypothetical protein